MPKVSSNPNGPVLRRNQACKTCRKKKLKCDAARPHCSNCVKAWKGMISVPAPDGYAHPEEPQCSYDPIEGLTLAESTNPAAKIRQLEEQISELQSRLRGAGVSLSPLSPSGRLSEAPNGSPPFANHLSAPVLPTFLDQPSPDPPGIRPEIALPRAGLAVANSLANGSPSSIPRSGASSPETRNAASSPVDSFMQLLFSGWNPDLPDPAVMRHFVNVFFEFDPCGSRILHRPSFLASMDLPPRDPRFPHSALLHAICASASRWTSTDAVVTPDGIRRDTFADYHAMKTRQYIDRTMASGADIFHVLQACVILSWYFYSEGRWVEVWIFAGFQTRVAIPLRLNYPGTFTTHGNSSPGAYLAPPKDLRDLEMRRRTWWMSLVFDRIASVGGWLHGVDERDIGTEFPLRWVDFETDFETEISLPPSNPQDLETPDVFVKHPPEYTDSFLLLIKAVMLFGKVTDYNVRFQLRLPATPAKSNDPTIAPGFKTLDKLVAIDFLASLPPAYQNCLGYPCQSSESLRFDTDLYLVHIVPHAATITLHNPYINFDDPNCLSTNRCLHSSRVILNTYYSFINAASSAGGPPPITKLHPFATICWYLAAVVQVQLCRRMIEIGDIENEHIIWGEINVLRWAMLDYGAVSPIGTRQEKLLKQLMNEIVRMTKHDKPLEVGVPLYTFSHQGVFSGTSAPLSSEESIAPLPVSPPFETMSSSPNGIMGPTASITSSWGSRTDITTSPPTMGPSPTFLL